MAEFVIPGDTVTWLDDQNQRKQGLVIKDGTDAVLVSPMDTRPGDHVWIDRALLFLPA